MTYMNKYKFKHIILFLMNLFEMCCLTALFAVVWFNYYGYINNKPIYYKNGNILIFLMYAVLILVFFILYDGFRIATLTSTNIIYSQTIAMIMVNVLAYVIISLLAYRMQNAVPMILLCLMQISIIFIFTMLSKTIYDYIYPPRKVLMIYGGNSSVNTLIAKMFSRRDRYIIAATLKTNKLSVVKEKVKDYEAVVLCDVTGDFRNAVISYCFKKSIRVYLTPTVEDILLKGSSDISTFDTPLFLIKGKNLNFEQRIVKRLSDIIISLIGIIITSPIMIVTAILIRSYDGGPALFKQVRSTLDGKEFSIYKFRSMITDAEADGKARFASVNDSRITPIGNVIRRFRIDELPQLFNILKGDMAVVGPRPERPEIINELLKEMPEFSYRMKVKAGLTGYAQVIGRYNTTLGDKLKMDLMYIENYSLYMDLKIIMLTIKILFMKESTEGVSEENSIFKTESPK